MEKQAHTAFDPWLATVEQPPLRRCEYPSCAGEGQYRAPKGRERLRDYYWFCLEHVRDYNRRWDFYAGMNQSEIEAQLRRDTVWQRPTWPLGGPPHHGKLDARRVRDYFSLFGDGEWRRPETREPRYDTPEGRALAVFDLDGPVTLIQVKTRYKELVKRHHPDANGGDKEAEERLKLINQAYTTLKSAIVA